MHDARAGTHQWGELSAKEREQITQSQTEGFPPGYEAVLSSYYNRLAQEKVRPMLAISLNASNNDLRTQLMPLNKKWNLEQLIAAAREFPLRSRERVTFEYVLLRGVNDRPENAKEVVELLPGIKARVNLIALNPGPGIDYETPSDESVAAFQNILRDAGILTFVRRPRGRDIYAACGQLKRTVEIATLPAR